MMLDQYRPRLRAPMTGTAVRSFPWQRAQPHILPRQIASWLAAHHPYHWLVGTSASVLILVFFNIFFTAGKTNVFNDGAAKLNLARRVFDNAQGQFSLAQLGGVWLPLMSSLEMPTIWIDSFYRTGLSGSIISMISFVVLTLILFEIVRLLTGSVLGGIAASGVIALNLNLIYFGTSTMAEMLLMALMAGCALSLIKLEQTASQESVHPRWIVIGAVMFGLICVARYEGYYLTACAVPVTALALWRRNIRGHKLVAMVGTLFVVPFFVIFCWLVYQFAIFGDPLFFARSKYSAHEIDVVGFQINNAYGDLSTSFSNYLYAIQWNYSDLILGLALAGAATFVFCWAIGRERMITPLFLGAIPVFYVISLYRGEMALLPKIVDPYNVRYGLTAGVTIAVAIGYLVGRVIGGRRATVSRVGLGIGLVLIGMMAADSLPAWKTPVANARILQDSGAALPDGTEESVIWLNAHYDGGNILSGSWNTAYLQLNAGIPLSHFITEASPALWALALAHPEKQADWIYVTIAPNDQVRIAIEADPDFDASFVEVNETEAGTIYRKRAWRNGPVELKEVNK